MNRIYYDCGTTNTRIYLFDGSRPVRRLSASVGSRDCALDKSRSALLQRLKELYDRILYEAGLRNRDVGQIWMSGMISSATGILEVPHLTAPVDLKCIRQGIVPYYEPDCFSRTLYIIPGVKTSLRGRPVTEDTFFHINNMRGEETEIFGILDEYPSLAQDSILILPGSHTQIARIRQGAIVNILSTVTGELYSALVRSTLLSTSLASSQKEPVDPAMVGRGFRMLKELGFNRALYTVRTMELFLPSTAAQRQSYFEGILNGSVADSVLSLIAPGSLPQIAVYGNDGQIQIFRALFGELDSRLPFMGIAIGELPYSAKGFLCVSRGYFA